MHNRLKPGICLLLLSLVLTGCSKQSTVAKPYETVKESIPLAPSDSESSNTKDQDLLFELMNSCARQSALEEFKQPAVIIKSRLGQTNYQIHFEQDGYLYDIELLENLPDHALNWCNVRRVKDGKLNAVNMSKVEGSESTFTADSVFDRDAFWDGDNTNQIQQWVLEAITMDSTFLVREFGQYFEVWLHASSDTQQQYGWRITDFEGLQKAVSNSRYAKLGTTIPADVFGTFTVFSDGAIINWNNSSTSDAYFPDGIQNYGGIRTLEGMNTQFWVDFFNNIPAEQTQVDLNGAWPAAFPAL